MQLQETVGKTHAHTHIHSITHRQYKNNKKTGKGIKLIHILALKRMIIY